MKNILTNSIQRKILQYVKSNYTKLSSDDFVLGEINYTFRCHLNAVQKIKEGKAEKVYSCIAVNKEGDWLCVHFINQNADGKFVDHTWGWTKQRYDYYLISEISENEQDYIGNILMDTKKSLISLHTNWLEKLYVKPDII